MIPWPIALLTLYYGALAAASAATAWRILAGVTHRPLWAQLAWLILCSGAAMGLALLKPWGRRWAIWASVALMTVLLAIAGMLVIRAREPGLGIAIACMAGMQMLIIRYLCRPMVRAWFDSGTMTGTR